MNAHVRSSRVIIEARNLTKAFSVGAHTVTALGGVTLSIESGEFVAIMGASGSGKSSLMNLIGTLDRPSGGELEIGGHEVSRLDDDSLAGVRNRFIGFVFQHFNLLPRTSALEQVTLPLRYRRVPAREAEARARARLAQVGLADRSDHHPQQLSGGQQQRVAIARALACDPLLVLADEPTGALDSRTSSEIMRLLVELNEQGVTIVLVTHDAEVAAYAKRCITMRDGAIIEDRTLTHRHLEASHAGH